MARPIKRGLDYYPKDVTFYDDFKIMSLLDDFGPLGVTVYEVLLCFVYQGDGYYLESPIENLATLVRRKIGGRWCDSREQIVDIIHKCVELGLFDRELFEKGVITSRGIQRRYAEVTARRKADRTLYWLLPAEDSTESGPDERASDEVFAEEKTDSAAVSEVITAETEINSAGMRQTKQKQTKENKTKGNESKANESKAEQTDARLGCAVHMEFAKIKQPDSADTSRLDALTERYGESAVLAAIESAIRKGGKSVGYVERILSDLDANIGYYGGAGGCSDSRFSGCYPPTYDAELLESLGMEWFASEEI